MNPKKETAQTQEIAEEAASMVENKASQQPETK